MSGNNQNPMAELLRVVDLIVNPLAEAGRRFEQWRERNEPEIRRLSEMAAQAMDGLPNWLSLCATTFARGGWSSAPLGLMELSESMELVKRLRDEPDEVVRRELDRAIPEYFRRDGHAKLRRLVSGWDDEHFRGDRRRVFEEALWAHRHGRYVLSIHSLAPQIEGVLREVTGMHGQYEPWMDHFNDAFGFAYDRRRPAEPDWNGELADFWSLPTNERYERSEAFQARLPPASRQAVEVRQTPTGSYQRELVNCGKERCKKCAEGPSHGPYWYHYFRCGGRLTSRYVGKELPAE